MSLTSIIARQVSAGTGEKKGNALVTATGAKKIFIFFLISLFFSLPDISCAAEKRILAGDSVIGGGDFVGYWSAYQMLRTGGNSYDRETAVKIQQAIDPRTTDPQIFLNPPWMLVIFAPLLSLNFPAAAHVWLFINILLTIFMAFLARRLLPGVKMKSPLYSVLLAFMSAPVGMAIRAGQLSILIAVLTLGTIIAFIERRDLLAGFCLSLLTIKFQSIYLLLLIIGFQIIDERRWKILVGFGATFSFILLTTYLVEPSSFHNWFEKKSFALSFKTSSFTTLVRYAVGFVTGNSYDSRAAIIFPIIVGIGTTVFMNKYRALCRPAGLNKLYWQRFFPALTALSIFTAPYIWIYDFSLLTVLQIAILSQITERRKYYKIFSAVLLGQVILTLCQFYGIKALYFSWFPVYACGIYYWGINLIRTAASDKPERMHQMRAGSPEQAC